MATAVLVSIGALVLGKIRRRLEFATTDEWFAKIVYSGIHKYLDENASIYVRKRNSKKDLYKIMLGKHVL